MAFVQLTDDMFGAVAMIAKFCPASLQIMVVSTTAFLVAGRFGLAPTLRQQATSGLRLVDNGTKGLSTGDPAGMQLPIKTFCVLVAVQQLGITCLHSGMPCQLSETCCAFLVCRAHTFMHAQVSQLLMFLGMELWDTSLVLAPSFHFG